MRFTKEEEAVSPVIGVILMVAITVILAAVIAVFVFGLAGDLESSAQKDVKLQFGTSTNGTVTVLVFSGKDISSLDELILTNGSEEDDITVSKSFTIGDQIITSMPREDKTIIITGNFSNGPDQVLGKI